jgi:hypothetical protein
MIFDAKAEQKHQGKECRLKSVIYLSFFSCNTQLVDENRMLRTKCSIKREITAHTPVTRYLLFDSILTIIYEFEFLLSCFRAALNRRRTLWNPLHKMLPCFRSVERSALHFETLTQ